MPPPIGFLLLTHNRPEQARRLVRALNALYGEPPIVVHHDWSQCSMEGLEHKGNVTFVSPHHKTSWGSFDIVNAVLAGIRAFAALPEKPEWMTLLSGSDYPARPGEDVVRELHASNADALIDYEEIDPRRSGRDWHDECVIRYFRFYVPVLHRAPHGFSVTHEPVKRPRALWLFSPYSSRFRCFAGSQWFSARRETAARVVAWSERNPWLTRHLDERWCSDETYFQTVLCNLKGVRLSQGNRRYIDWSEGHAHPKTLTLDDLPAVAASGAHFARKFQEGSEALDELDRRLGVAVER